MKSRIQVPRINRGVRWNFFFPPRNANKHGSNNMQL